MELLVGQPMDARRLELETSPWSPERFASMCDALVWAASGRRCPGFPSFTMRVNAPDRGVDAEWHVELPEEGDVLPTPIVGPGWNVFQCKKRDLIAQDRRRIVSGLRSHLRKALANVTAEHQRNPDRYILFVNVDLKHDQTAALEEAILEDHNATRAPEVVIIDAGGLAALLNNHPHLREAYFARLSFRSWKEADLAHRRQKLFGFDVSLVGREDPLGRLKALLDDSRVRAVIVTGPHDIGKSRLVLEATKHRPHDTAFALDPRSMKLEDYRKLASEQRDVVCIVEDPDPEQVDMLANEALGVERFKLVITLPSSDDIPNGSYGTDERIQSLSVVPLADEDARKLLNATGKRLDFGVESWILDRAGGNPGVLLAAASVGEKLRETADDFGGAVGKEFAKRIESELGQDKLACARLLSPLTHVGVAGRFENELDSVCSIFGDGEWRPSRVLSELEELEKAGLAKRGGSFAEITIPFLANYLVTELLRGRRSEIFALFGRLNRSGRIRLIRRLSQITSQEVERFWDALFDSHDPQAPFGSLTSALCQDQMLRFLAGLAPERTIRLLEEGLLQTSCEERLAISGERRRELMWALEQLLFRAATSRRALKVLWLPAEAENEKWGNNASGILAECLHPLHGQMPLPLDERLEALRGFTSAGASKEGRLVAIGAAGRLSANVQSHFGIAAGRCP